MTAKAFAKMTPAERITHAAMLIERICESRTPLPAAEREFSGQFLLEVFGEFDLQAQITLAKKLAPSPAMPPILAAHLANGEQEVAIPILRYSPVIGDPTFINLIARADGPRHMAIAERKDLSAPVTEALLQHAGPDVIMALVRNPAARFSSGALKILSWRTIGNPDLEEALCMRNDLPAAFTDKILRSVLLRTELRYATVRHEFDADTVRLTLRTIEAPDNVAGLEPFEPAAEIAAPIAKLAAQRGLKPEHFDRFISGGKVDEIACSLAALNEVSPALARQVLRSENSSSLAILARAIDLPVETYRNLLAMIRRCDAADPAINRDVKTYRKIPDLVARKVVALHRRRRRDALKRRNERSLSAGVAAATA